MYQPSHISLAQFEELRELLEEDFNELIHTYIEDSQKRLTEMQSAFEQNDNLLGFEAAHSLKGASANLGAIYLDKLCYQLQEICRANQIKAHADLINVIINECHTVNTEIQALMV